MDEDEQHKEDEQRKEDEPAFGGRYWDDDDWCDNNWYDEEDEW